MKTSCLRAFLLLLLSGMVHASMAQPPADIRATAYAPVQPVLRGMKENVFIRIAVSVPADTEPLRLEGLICRSVAGMADVQQADAFLTGAEPFSAKEKIGTAEHPGASFIIPFDIRLSPGQHFIWISVTLKTDAVPGHIIELHAEALKREGHFLLPVKEIPSGFRKFTGIALCKAGDQGINTFRIPGITRTEKGTLIAVYDNRYVNSKDLPGNIDVGMSRSTDGGRTWAPMQVIMDMGEPQDQNGIGDPSILYDPATKKIWVAALWSKGNRSIAGSGPGLSPDETGQFVLVSSADDGLTWSKPASITASIKDPAWKILFQGPGAGIAMKDGTLVFPAQYWDEKGIPWSTIVCSKDHGQSWMPVLKGPKSNTTEAQVAEISPGLLMLNMRDNRGGFRSIAVTKDLGHSWTEHPTSYTALPDPVCMGSLLNAELIVKGKQQPVLFFSNPATSGGRYNISIKASTDQGNTWNSRNTLLLDERSVFGYSCLVKVDDRTIGILYEGTRDLYYVPIPVSAIVK